jgi:phage N-6-adenine-methyltransferase
LFERLNAEFGFQLDVCATADNTKCARFFDKTTDGLTQDWHGVCWCNPPYGKHIGLWIEKAAASAAQGATVVCLVPARPDTRAWHQHILGNANAEVRYIRGRLKFGHSKNTAPFPSAVVVFRAKSFEGVIHHGNN